jgi:hypothetical protein
LGDQLAIDTGNEDHHDLSAVEVYGVTRKATGPLLDTVRAEMRGGDPGRRHDYGKRIIMHSWRLVGLFWVGMRMRIWNRAKSA